MPDLINQHTGDLLGTLFTAVSEGNLLDVKRILNSNFPRQTFKNISSTLLHQAVNNLHCNVLQFLLENSAFIDSTNAQSLTPLHIAANKGSAKIVRLLLVYDAHINAVDYDNRSPLYYATYDGHIDCVNVLLNNEQIDIGIKRSGGWTPLHEAARFGHLECLKSLIRYKANIFARTDDAWWTPGHMAASSGRLDCLKYLISAGININAAAGPNHTSTLLHEAAHSGHTECVKFLLEAGADATIYDRHNLPHHLASKYGHAECLEEFLIYFKNHNKHHFIDIFTDVDPSLNSLSYHNALHMASLCGRNDCIKVLLKHGARHLSNAFHQTPLSQAAIKSYIDCIKTILADVQVKKHFEPTNSAHYNALHHLCLKTYKTTERTIACACLLLNSGLFDVDSLNEDWVISPCLHLAARNGAYGLVKFLLFSGANPWLSEGLQQPLLNVGKVKSSSDLIENAKNNPRSLKLFCRITIRKMLSTELSTKAHNLPLPKHLRHYVLHGHDVKDDMCVVEY